MNEGDGMPKEEKESCCVLQLRLYPEPWQVQIIETRFKVLEHLKNSLIALELRKLRKSNLQMISLKSNCMLKGENF